MSQRFRDVGSVATGALFIAAGTLHFRFTRPYEAIVPPLFPAHRELVLISGACEILGGVGVLFRPTRRYAAWGLIALLVAVFPANVYMVVDARRFSQLAPSWALAARLPLQTLFVWWIYAVGAKPRRG
ncbi:MAG: DoxX family membrane protein [Candidatus Eremiobacteraeota bacterium]|nr:DoxX family membrane protein [Candidatus Eremiobacteraeota bacterium]MBC5802319.1 DoxX family membrane protein [Candidatus Eremiobacteraeota bacterium]MBC5822654.1 DoxX family membrane protein [Candidatus Eremiobacteraeota bacterium]